MMRTLLQATEIRCSQATIDEFDENEHEGRRDAHVVTSEHSNDGGDQPRAPATRHYQRLQGVEVMPTFELERGFVLFKQQVSFL